MELLILLCNKRYEKENLLPPLCPCQRKGQGLVCSGSDGPHLHRLRPRTLGSCSCQFRLFYCDVTTQLFLRPLKVYFGSKYQTGFCLREKGGGGRGRGIKDDFCVCFVHHLIPPSVKCVFLTVSERWYDVRVQEAETECLSPRGCFAHYTWASSWDSEARFTGQH